jgi:predicted SprT family Zn-dependent metalloprotease
MALLKAYEWEREKFPQEREIWIPAEERIPLTQAIARHLGLPLGPVELRRRGGGGQYHHHNRGIWLAIPSKSLPLGTIYHELAHLLHHVRFNGSGHTGKFKNCLRLVYFNTRPKIDALRQMVKNDIAFKELAQQGAAMVRAEREQRAAQQRAERTAIRKQPEFKLQQIENRIKRLQSRAKRIATLIKSANRSAAAYRRVIAAKASKSQMGVTQ